MVALQAGDSNALCTLTKCTSGFRRLVVAKNGEINYFLFMIQNYIFAYGSLMNAESRPAGVSRVSIPLIASGVERSLSLVAANFGATAFGASLKLGSQCLWGSYTC